MNRKVVNILSLAVIALIGWAALPAEAGRIALLVGVGDYKDKDINRLEGPPNDVRALHAELTNRWGFDAVDVRTLIDRQATREAILSELTSLERRSKPGDHLFVYFSGHGTSRYDPNRLPLPHSTGAFLPWDFPKGDGVSTQTQLENLIRGDRDLKPVISSLEQNGRELFVVSDSCYSGQAVRSLYADSSSMSLTVPRYTPLTPRDPGARDELQSMPGLGSGRKPDPYPYSNVVFLAAASDSEASVDIPARALKQYPTLDGKPHGALTDALLRVLKGELPADLDQNEELDYAEVSRVVQDFVATRGYGHTPRILPGLDEDRHRLTARSLFGDAPAPATALTRPIPDEETLRVRVQGAPRDLAERLRTERGVSLVGAPADVIIRAEAAGFRLLGPAQDQIGFADSAEQAIGHVRQLAWAKRLRTIGERGRHGLLEMEANPVERGGTFIEGERLNFVFRTDRDVVLLLLNVDAEGKVTILYPNRDNETQPIAGHTLAYVPGSGDFDMIKVESPFGTDFLFAFGFDSPPVWLPKVMKISKAPPGAENLLALERYLRDSANRYSFGTLELRTISAQALR